MTTGGQRWDFVYVDDVVAAYLRLLTAPDLPNKHEVFNIGTGRAVSVREVVMKIQEIVGSDVEPDWGVVPSRRNEVWFICADIRKGEKLLGWRPKTDILETGLELTVKWYEEFLEGREKDASRSY
jgi:nucleoside-diphosphate-sugar epimerase